MAGDPLSNAGVFCRSREVGVRDLGNLVGGIGNADVGTGRGDEAPDLVGIALRRDKGHTRDTGRVDGVVAAGDEMARGAQRRHDATPVPSQEGQWASLWEQLITSFEHMAADGFARRINIKIGDRGRAAKVSPPGEPREAVKK